MIIFPHIFWIGLTLLLLSWGTIGLWFAPSLARHIIRSIRKQEWTDVLPAVLLWTGLAGLLMICASLR
jgi:hypothetical protein